MEYRGAVKEHAGDVSGKYVLNTPRGYQAAKRVFDIVISALVLVLCLIPMGIIALLIKLESPGAALFKQERLGLDGKPYLMYKFRSMRPDAEREGPQWASVNDDRCTKVGRVLRKCHLDELPQIWNILRGEMSLVGPRPELEYFYAKFEKEEVADFRQRLRVIPGLTGLAQVKGGYDLSPAEKFSYDMEYMKIRSVWTDLKILLQTVCVIFTGKGAR